MTGVTHIEQFDNFFIDNYKYLLGFTRSIDVRNDYESLLHDCYLKCKYRIMLSGYSGNSYLNYVRVTIMNTYKTSYRDRKKIVDYDDLNYMGEIEEVLQDTFDYEQQRELYEYEMQYLNTMIYDYVDKYFTPKEQAIFKTYYLLKRKHINYKILAQATNYSQTSVSNTVKKIKKSLKENLMCYINTNMNIMELQDKIKRIEQTLAKPFNKNLGEYKSCYILAFDRPFKSSCSCQLGRMRTDLLTWVATNKKLLNQNK